MKFVVVERLPEKSCGKKRLEYILEEFMNMNVKFAKFEFNENEYKHANSAYGNLRRAAVKLGLPITVRIRNNEVYFERRDLD